MARFRVGVLLSLVFDDYYVIQKKHWYGWTTERQFDYKSNAITYAKELEARGHIVEWHL